MKKTSGMVIVKVNDFHTAGNELSYDSNDLSAKYLHPIAGECPDRMVIAGTIADSLGISTGNSYLMQWSWIENDEVYGPVINWETIQQEPLKVLEIMQLEKEYLGPGKLFSTEQYFNFTPNPQAKDNSPEETSEEVIDETPSKKTKKAVEA